MCAARDRRGHSPPNDATMEGRGARNHGAGSQTLLQTKSQPERGRASRCALTQPGCLGFMREFWRAPAQAGLHVAWAAVTADPTAHLPAWPRLSVRLFYQMYRKWGIGWPGDVTRPLVFKDKRGRLLVRRSLR